MTYVLFFFFFKQKTAYELRISDWSSDVCSSDLQSEAIGTLVQRIDAGLRGRLRIGFVGSMLYRGLPDLLAAMRAALPDVEHVLSELNSHDQLEAVRRGDRKRVVLGKRVWVRVGPGGARNIKKKTKKAEKN